MQLSIFDGLINLTTVPTPQTLENLLPLHPLHRPFAFLSFPSFVRCWGNWNACHSQWQLWHLLFFYFKFWTGARLWPSRLTFDMIMYICCAAIACHRRRQGAQGGVATDTEGVKMGTTAKKTLIYQRLLDYSVFLSHRLCFSFRLAFIHTSLFVFFAVTNTLTHILNGYVCVCVAARQKCPYNIFYFVTQILK